MTPPAAASRWAPLAAIVAVFLFAGSRQLERPGLLHDEALDSAYGMEVALGLPVSETDWSATLGSTVYPLRSQHPYDFSAFEIYWSALAFKLGGVSAACLRWSSLVWSAGTLAVFYALCVSWFGAPAAVGAALLLALNPAFLVYSRVGYFAIESFLLLPALGALALAERWRRRREAWTLCAAAFCLGFGLNVTTKGLAFVLAYPLVFLALARRKDLPSPRVAAAAALCALIGAADFAAYNLARGGPILRYLLRSLAAPTRGGVDNLALGVNLLTRLRQLGNMLDGSAVVGIAGPGTVPDRAFAVLAGAAAALAAARLLSRRRWSAPGGLWVAALLAPAILLETCFTPARLNGQHLLVLWPSLFLLIAAALRWAHERVSARFPRRAWAGSAAVAVLLAAPLAAAARADASFAASLRAFGGARLWSDAVNDLAADLDARAVASPVCLDWGAARSVYVLTSGRVHPRESIDYRATSGPELLAQYGRWAEEPGLRAVAVAAEASANATSRLDAFRAVVEGTGRRLVPEREFRERSGRPLYTVWRVEGPAAAQGRKR